MHTSRITALLAVLLLALAASTASAQVSAPIHYTLDLASDYTEGCFPPCTCPLVFNPDLTGSFDMQRGAADSGGYVYFNVTNVNLVIGNPTLPVQVIGAGSYRRGGPPPTHEQLVLDMSMNGGGIKHFYSGLVLPAATFPDIDISIGINGMMCQDFVPHIVAHPVHAGTSYCFGDGSGTTCPCGNAGATGNGCASSVNTSGANLDAIGTGSLSADSVLLRSSGTSNAAVLFFQGTQRTSGGAGSVFGDGLRCASGLIRRLGTEQPVSGGAEMPGLLDPALSTLGGISATGTFEYQVWYRNAAAFCTPSTFNLTNGLEIVWTP